MAKINFTKDHFNKMCKGLLAMLLNNGVVTTKLGTPINVVELLHTTTINSLNNIRLSLAQKITANRSSILLCLTSATYNTIIS